MVGSNNKTGKNESSGLSITNSVSTTGNAANKSINKNKNQITTVSSSKNNNFEITSSNTNSTNPITSKSSFNNVNVTGNGNFEIVANKTNTSNSAWKGGLNQTSNVDIAFYGNNTASIKSGTVGGDTNVKNKEGYVDKTFEKTETIKHTQEIGQVGSNKNLIDLGSEKKSIKNNIATLLNNNEKPNSEINKIKKTNNKEESFVTKNSDNVQKNEPVEHIEKITVQTNNPNISSNKQSTELINKPTETNKTNSTRSIGQLDQLDGLNINDNVNFNNNELKFELNNTNKTTNNSVSKFDNNNNNKKEDEIIIDDFEKSSKLNLGLIKEKKSFTGDRNFMIAEKPDYANVKSKIDNTLKVVPKDVSKDVANEELARKFEQIQKEKQEQMKDYRDLIVKMKKEKRNSEKEKEEKMLEIKENQLSDEVKKRLQMRKSLADKLKK